MNDPLWHRGSGWLGRDAETNIPLVQPAIPGIAGYTADARHYGLHCTLRPPMRLAAPWHACHEAAARVAAATRPFELPPLQLACIDGFLALTLAEPSPPMRALADLCVQETNSCRAAPAADELARRRAAGLTPRQEHLLQTWGYPYVMDEWMFHITLTRRLRPEERALLMPAAEAHFAGALDVPRTINEICIFTSADSDFLIAERLPLA